ncbi:polyprenyl synthetase family protein [Nocardia nova]|uniref:polyprenyl synthetase family protein n=1 Tax=Nocardia nova TaxID=37330 RepID=UPI0033D4B758
MTVTSPTALPVLSRTRTHLLPVLDEWIGRLDGRLRHMCGYQLGMTDPDGTPTGVVGGKLLRPAFTLLCAEAAGVPTRDAIPSAAAIELLHNASLIHDDIMDGDRERRHRPTVWARFGVPEAILAGDAMIGLGFEVLGSQPHPAAGRALAQLAATLRRLGHGQDSDLSASARAQVSVADCLDTLTGKTGTLFGCACRLGVHFGSAATDLGDRFDRFGTQLGVAFQLVDDLLDIWGDTALTGRPAGSDLRARRKSAPVTFALTAEGAVAARIREMYTGETEFDDIDTALLADLITGTGAREWTRAEIIRRVEAAWHELEDIDLVPAARAELADLVAAMLGAEFAADGIC